MNLGEFHHTLASFLICDVCNKRVKAVRTEMISPAELKIEVLCHGQTEKMIFEAEQYYQFSKGKLKLDRAFRKKCLI